MHSKKVSPSLPDSRCIEEGGGTASCQAMSAEALKAHCGGVGEITDVELLTRGKNNRPSGSAILTYAYEESAAAGIQALEGTELDGRDLRVRAYYQN